MTDAQKEWLDRHPDFSPVGTPRPGVRFADVGTLYADGSFEPGGRLKPIVLRPGCFGVGRPTPAAPVNRRNM